MTISDFMKNKRMKEIIVFILLFSIVLCNVILTACENNKTPQSNIDEVTNKNSIPDRPTDEEIAALMKESFYFNAAYGYGNESMAALNGETKTYNGNLYTLAIEEIRDYKAWAERIKSTFTDELAKIYLNHIGIVDINGTAYVFGGGGSGEYDYDLYTYEIKSAEKGNAVLELSIPIAAWTNRTDEPLKSKVEMSYNITDGKWKISYEEYSILKNGIEK